VKLEVVEAIAISPWSKEETQDSESLCFRNHQEKTGLD